MVVTMRDFGSGGFEAMKVLVALSQFRSFSKRAALARTPDILAVEKLLSEILFLDSYRA